MPGGHRLVATGLLRGAGLFVRESSGWRRLDHLPSTGLAVSPEGRLVARALWTSDDPQTHGELIVSDATGVLRYLRVDELQETHGLAWDDELIVAVSTLRNTLLWIDGSGAVVRRASFEGEGDAWHLNCPAWADGRLVTTAFGRHDRHRDWATPGAMAGGGVILDVETGELMASGLSAPHDPCRIPGGWLVCDSRTHRLLRLDDDGNVAAEITLGGWTRGLAVDGDVVHVGVSVRRWDGGEGTGSVVTVRLDDLSEVRREALPCDEIFALVLVPERLVAGLEVGFSTNPAREAPLAPHGDVLAHGEPWEPAEPAATLNAAADDAVHPAGRWLSVHFTVTAPPDAALLPVGDSAWRIGARWLRAGAPPLDEGARARLAAPVLAGTCAEGRIRVRAPEQPGVHLLELRLLQEHRRWHATAAATLPIRVSPA